jgi:uncharacterized membrane protein YdbT with pleckstrin-like domain
MDMPPTATTPPIANGTVYRKLGHKAFYILTLKKSTTAICFLVLEMVLLIIQSSGVLHSNPQISSLLGGAEFIVFLIFLVALIVGLLAGYFSYIAFSYRVDDNSFLTERGITSRQETSLPFRQIQNVDIEQSLIYRIMGVCDLVILTAGHEDKQDAGKNESEIVLPALDITVAHDLRTYLLERANVQEVKPENQNIENTMRT